MECFWSPLAGPLRSHLCALTFTKAPRALSTPGGLGRGRVCSIDRRRSTNITERARMPSRNGTPHRLSHRRVPPFFSSLSFFLFFLSLLFSSLLSLSYPFLLFSPFLFSSLLLFSLPFPSLPFLSLLFSSLLFLFLFFGEGRGEAPCIDTTSIDRYYCLHPLLWAVLLLSSVSSSPYLRTSRFSLLVEFSPATSRIQR